MARCWVWVLWVSKVWLELPQSRRERWAGKQGHDNECLSYLHKFQLALNICQRKKAQHRQLDLQETSSWSYPAALQPKQSDSCLLLIWLEAAFGTSPSTAPAHASASPARDTRFAAVSPTSVEESTGLSVPGISVRKNGKQKCLCCGNGRLRSADTVVIPGTCCYLMRVTLRECPYGISSKTLK